MNNPTPEEPRRLRVTQSIDRAQPLAFTFDGQRFTGYAGDTVASALYRAGIRVFSRSFKYHRPRGLLCVNGACPNCLMNVNGTPNVQACTMPLAAGMQVRSQNAWPSLTHDLMAIADKLDRLLPVGFYYKTFIRPRALWPLYEQVLRHAAGLGTINPDPDAFVEPAYDKRYQHAEITVVGGGPAGMAAALAAADAGAQVLLIDENPTLGGHLRYQRPASPPADGEEDRPRWQQMAQAIADHPAIEVLTHAMAFGWYEDNLIGVVQHDRLIKLRTRQLIVATGQIEQPLVFHNNDLPGVFLGSGLQRLMHLYGIWPGRRALVVTTNDEGWTVARDLLEHQVDVAMVVDARPAAPSTAAAQEVQAAGIPVLPGHTIQSATGKESVAGAVVVRLDEAGQPVAGSEVLLKCDLIAVSAGFVPNNALLYQSGCKLGYDAQMDRVVPLAFVRGVRGAGHAIGTQGLESLLLDGRVAGLAAAFSLGKNGTPVSHDTLIELQRELEAHRQQQRAATHIRPLAGIAGHGRKKFVCFCEDVTEKDLQDAIGEGFDNIETLKRYSTISMGPCQGKMCSMNSIRLCARATGRTIAETGTTTSRPPFKPVKLGTLAGRKLEPVRYTPLHHEHLALGARMMDAGQWKRPEHYGSPHAEVLAVRERVGLIDVSTLGKMELHGPDAVQLLEWVYTNRFARLAPGRIRYGIMCTDEGILFDDGVVCRLAEDHFYLTTTTGGASTVHEWLLWWLAGTGWRVHVTNVTEAYAAINVAGPRARDVLRQITDVDLSNAAFPYMHVRTGLVAGVPARLLRIGFVGEMGYEIHVPAAYGAHVWQSLMQAGQPLAITPFGVEAQRILRLEKKHLIIGQDTDALSDPFAAGLDWVVQLDKEDFIGKPSLVRARERGASEQLVGFEMTDATIVPGEGEQVVQGGKIVGRITSARFSPTLGRSIGLAWVQADKAHAGALLYIRTQGNLATARVVCEPFYDPAGERLKQ